MACFYTHLRPCLKNARRQRRSVFGIDGNLKEAVEKAATEDHRSLILWLNSFSLSYLRRRRALTMSRRPSKEAARTAFQLVAREVDNIADKSVPAEERESRKRQLIRGSKEFRDIRSDQPKSKR